MEGPKKAGYKFSLNGDAAFILVVLAGYIVFFSSGAYTVSPGSPVVAVILGVIYLALGLWGSRVLESLNDWQKHLFFVAAVLLGGIICYMTSGAGWLILLPLVSEAIQHLRRPAAILVSIAVWIAEILPAVLSGSWGNTVAAMLGYLSAIVFVAVFTMITVNEQKMRAELSTANQRLREYASQAEELATIQERERLAREIHDGLGHYLTAVNIQLKAAQAVIKADPDAAEGSLHKAQTLTQEALADVRRSVSSLRSDPTAGKSMEEVLTTLAHDNGDSFQADVQIHGSPRALSTRTSFTLYRVAQEGLTNAAKHSRATRVEITLTYSDQAVKLEIHDNGQGTDDTAGGYGLIGLRERVQLVGGKLLTHSYPGQGFTLSAEIPDDGEAAHA